MKSNIGIIIRREFLERVTKKSFIATTLLMPIFMIAVMIAPTLITIFSTPEQVKIAVIDDSGLIAPTLKDDNSITFVQINDNLEIAKANDSIDGILVIGQNIVNTTSDVTFYSHDASSLLIEQNISSQLEKAIENIRRENYNIEGLDEIVESLNVDINLTTYRINETEDSTSSSFLSYAIGMAMSLLLYMFLLLYGQLVMTSIIEEKNNRVLEIMVSSIKPGQLMLGKILGIGSVALTQVAIWGIILVSISAFVLPAILPTDKGDKVFYAKWEEEIIAEEVILNKVTELLRYEKYC